MEIQHNAANCRWATPTLLLSAPFWLAAWDAPWACTRNTVPRVLDTFEVCTTCPRWEPLSDDGHRADHSSNPLNGQVIGDLSSL
jgi:hypothetical protein